MFRKLLSRLFPYFEKLGIHVLPVHYYSPIPAIGKLREKIWQRVSELPGINMNEEIQLKLLEEFEKYSDEFNSFPLQKGDGFYVFNPSFGSVDAEIYYCMIRHFRPRKIIEVGAGFSTLLAAETVERNAIDCEIVAIDPYPQKFLKANKRIKVVEKPVEEVGLEEFKALGENDILFIDSTHTVKVGGDVVYLYLEVLPRLKKGVLVHFHDIFLPLEYPRDWVMKMRRFWNEQYLLQAFLAFNDAFEVLWSGSYMNLKHPERLERIFRSYVRNRTFPGSFWIRRVR
jgi:predicted O-methyltransferase YrrM